MENVIANQERNFPEHPKRNFFWTLPVVEKELPVKGQIPQTHLDLVNGPRVAALTTVMPDGQLQTTVVWCNYDGTHVLVNTMRDFRKEKNMCLNSKVTLLCYYPRQPLHFVDVRSTLVEMTETGALEHLDRLCRLYTG